MNIFGIRELENSGGVKREVSPTLPLQHLPSSGSWHRLPDFKLTPHGRKQ